MDGNANNFDMDRRSVSVGRARTTGLPTVIGPQYHHMALQLQRMPYGMGPRPPQQVFVEDHMNHLGDKLDMLENELRYAWKALDVLSQEYIKMWERLEKMEGLLTEQQTVISQLIDLYTGDSSDNGADNSFDNDRGSANFVGKAADEAFYKALNVVHRDSYPEAVDNSPSLSYNNTANPMTVDPVIDTVNAPKMDGSSKKKKGDPFKHRQSVEDKKMNEPEKESRSTASRPVQGCETDVLDFPVEEDTSPSYENIVPVLGNQKSVPGSIKRKLPKVPGTSNAVRTRKDGYIGAIGDELLQTSQSCNSPSGEGRSKLSNERFSSDSLLEFGNVMHDKHERKDDVLIKTPDTYPRRKTKSNKEISLDKNDVDNPITVIDGNYSFSLSKGNVDKAAKESTLDNCGERKEEKIAENEFANFHSQSTNNDNGSGNQLSKSLKETPSDLGQNTVVTRANSLFQQIQARESDPSLIKCRKLSLKEKRKLRTEQRELVYELVPKTIEESHQQQKCMSKKPDSSESDVSMRSDHSISPKRESEDQNNFATNGILMEHVVSVNSTRPQSNGINLLPAVQQQLMVSAKPSSREFAVSRALGKYRQKQKKEKDSFQVSSNSDSQEELDLSAELTEDYGFKGTLRNIDAKIANIEEQSTEKVSEADEKLVSEKHSAPQNEIIKKEQSCLELNKPEKSIENKKPSEVEVLKMPQTAMSTAENTIKHGEAEDKAATKVYNSDKEDDSSDTGGADDDSETQSGVDTVDEDETTLLASEFSNRPANLKLLTSNEEPFKISDKQPKPDLLEEVTAAAAEAAFLEAYPEHLKNGYYGEDGAWYDEHGETGYYDEDGTFFEYIDEIGYYADDGEWVEYDYTKGSWGEDGEWHEFTDKHSDDDTKQNESDHFLWVSEERIKNKYSNDQILSSKLNNNLVIGRPSASLIEDICDDYDYQNNKIEPNEIKEPIEESDNESPKHEKEIEKEDDSEIGGNRWSILVKERKSDLIQLVRYFICFLLMIEIF